jgi:hypothetical protein
MALMLFMLITEKLLLSPLYVLTAFHLPTWLGWLIVVAVLSWLIGE